jgi:hypothetical protein
MHLALQSGAVHVGILPGYHYHPYQVHLGLRSGATATLVNGRVSSSYEHRLGEQVRICSRGSK